MSRSWRRSNSEDETSMNRATSLRNVFPACLLTIGVAVSTMASAQSHLKWENHDPLTGNYKIYNSIAASGRLVFAVGEAGLLADLASNSITDNRDAFVR